MFEYLDKLLLFLGISFDKNYDEDYDSKKYNTNENNNTDIKKRNSNDYKININTLNHIKKNNNIEMKQITIHLDNSNNSVSRNDTKNSDNSISNNEDSDEGNGGLGLVSLNCFCNCKKNDNDFGCCNKYNNITSYYIYFTLYKCLIFLILSFTPSLYLYDVIINNNKDIIPTISFTIMQPFLYIIIHDVFSTNYFLKIYHESHNPKYKKIHYCLPNEKKIVISVITISSISAIASFIFYLISEKAFIYDELNNVGDVFVTIMYFLNWIYGRLILSLSLNVFFYVFIKQLKDLKYIYYKIDPDNVENMIGSMPVADLLHDIIWVRHNFNTAIRMLEYVYITATICGSISIAYIIDYGIYTSDNIAAGGLYVVIQGLFMCIIALVEQQRQKLLVLIRSTKFSEKYILRRNEICRACMDIENKIKNNLLKDDSDNNSKSNNSDSNNSHSNNSSSHNSSSDDRKSPSINKCIECLDNKNLDNKCLDNKNFNDCEININSYNNINTQIKKPKHSFVLRNRLTKMVNENIESHSGKKHKRNRSIYSILYDNKMNTFDYVKCSYEWVKSTGQMIDWTILTNALNDEWEAFSLFGIKFNNGSAFKKAVATTSLAITFIKYMIDYLEL
jgi:hypothetical protein